MKKLVKLLSIITMAAAGAFALVNVSNKSSDNFKVQSVEAAAGKLSKDTPMIVNAWGGDGNIGTGLYNGCDVGLHCWGGDLTQAVTVKMDKVSSTMGAGIVPKGTQYVKVVRAPSGSLPCNGFPDGNYNEWGQWSIDSTKNVITIKHWENEDDNQYYADTKEILLAGRPVMFDCDSGVGSWWFNNNCTPYIMTNAQNNWYNYTTSDAWNKLTRINTSGYMYFIPSSTIIADYVIVTRNTTNTPGWGAKQNQTTNMVTGYGFNPLYTTQIESGTSDGKQNWGNKSAIETASEYGYYFMDKITCDGLGSITSAASNWTTVKNTYSGLTKDVQGECWKASGNSSGNNIEKAMLQYDYIVFFKQYSGYNDFINRSSSEGKSYSSPQTNLLVMNSEKPTTVMIITVISLVSVSAIGGFFFIKKRKETN